MSNPYQIFYTDPAKNSYYITVADNTIYKGVGTGGLTLVGRNYPSYGQYIAENFIHLLENFANTVPPENPVEGQLWYDNASKKLRINDGAASNVNWKPINGLYQQATEPNDAVAGDLWVDLTLNQVKMHDGFGFNIVVGPDYSGNTSSGPKVETVIDSTGDEHKVVVIKIDGIPWAVIADDSYSTADIDGFTNFTLKKGINIKDDSVFNGVADSANNIRQLGVKVSGNSFVRNDINQSLNGQIAITQDSNALKIGADSTFIIERTTGGSNANFVNTFESYGTFSFNIKDNTLANRRVMTIGGQDQQVRINSVTPSNTTTGALYVEGGALIKKDVYVGGQLYFVDDAASTLTVATLVLKGSTASTSTNTGALKVAGGVGIGGSLYLNGDLSVKSRVLLNGSVGTSGQVLATNGASSVYWTSLNTGGFTGGTVSGDIQISSPNDSALVVAGGATISKNVSVGGYVSATNVTVGQTVITTSTIITNTTINNSNTTQSTTVATGAVVIAGGLGVGKNVNIGGTIAIDDSTNSTSTTTGALRVAGGAGIRGDLYVGGGIFSSRLTIDETVINSTVVQTGDQFTITNTTNATSTITGALRVSGGAGIGRDVFIGGTAYVKGSPVITTATLGGATIDGQSIRSQTGTISVNTATLMAISVDAVNVLTTATDNHIGGILIGDNVTIDEHGRLSMPLATTTTFGIIRPAGTDTSGIIVDNGVFRVVPATTDILGGVRVGAGLKVFENGTIILNTGTLVSQAVSITTPASTSTLGAVRIGQNINVTTSGTISVPTGAGYELPPASTSSIGGVIIGTGIDYLPNGTISINTATLVTKRTTAYGVTHDTKASIDNLQARISPAGVPQIKTGFTTSTIMYSCVVVTSTGASYSSANTGTTITTSSWTDVTSTAITVGGESVVAQVQDIDNSHLYRLTYVHTLSANSGSVVFERLI